MQSQKIVHVVWFFLLDLYFSKLPEFPAKDDVFNLRPKVKVPSSPGEPWFDCTPIGKNKLATMMKEMSVEAGFQETKTNHSLRATGATTLFNAGLPEKNFRKTRGIDHLKLYAGTKGYLWNRNWNIQGF